MLLDISPILVCHKSSERYLSIGCSQTTLLIKANVILKIYGFRLGELLASNNATALDGQPLKMIGITSTVREVNFFMLLLFGTTLFITILLHSIRLARTLVLEKHAYTLATLVLEKIACVLFDLLTNSFLLYQVLVWRQERMFELDLTMNLLLAVFAVSRKSDYLWMYVMFKATSNSHTTPLTQPSSP